MGPAVIIPVVAGGVALIGAAALRMRAVNKLKATAVAPNFNASPPAPAAIPAGRNVTGIPVITADQFAKQSAVVQADIRDQALKGILTLTATDGTLFSEKPPQPAEDFIGVFKPGEDLKGLFIVVDPALSRRFGLPLPIPDGGNAIFEALEKNGATTVAAISRDPRMPGMKAAIPLNAITGAGDPG